ncbi:MAG TPA: glycosyltransferase family 4 protein [Armatimonadota bacterium]|jgi:glycosyltransferase involved in cell wall biosynthesis
MRLAFLVEDVSLKKGQERVTAELLRRLVARHEVHLFGYTAADLPPEIHVHRLWNPRCGSTLRAFLFPYVAGWALRGQRFDVVLSTGGNSFVSNFVLTHTCHADRRRFLGASRPGEPPPSALWRLLWNLRSRWACAMERRAVRRCPDRTIAVSGALARALARAYDLPLSHLLVAPNGVDHDLFHPGLRGAHRAELRAELGLDEPDFVVLFVGGLWLEKGLPLVVAALAQMQHPARLVVVGSGDEEALRRIAAAEGVADRVLLVGRRDDVHRFYGAADCFAFPSESEGFGLVMAEAAAAGLPVIATRVGIAEDLIEDGRSGYLVEGDVAQIADRLDRLAADPPLRRALGEAAGARAQTFTWERQAELVEEFFAEKCAAVPPTPEKLRVAVLSHACVVDVNQRLYADLAAAHPEWEVLVIAPDHWRNPLSGERPLSLLPAAAALVHPLPVHLAGKMHLHWYHRGPLTRLLRNFRPDVVMAHEEPYSLAGAQAGWLAHRLGARMILCSQQNLYRPCPPPLAWSQAWLLRHVDWMLPVTPEVGEIVRQRGFSGPQSLLANGFDETLFRPEARGDGSLRRELGLTRPVLGYAGRLEPAKGLRNLLESARLLRLRYGDDFQLFFIGEGSLLPEIQAFAAQHLAPGQLVHQGYVPHHRMGEYMAAMDVLVLPSLTTPTWKEQFGRVIVEALACEVPVVGSDSGHIPVLLEETGGGLVFPEGQVEPLAACLEQLLRDSELRRQLGKHGHDVVMREYTWQRWAEHLYDALCGTMALPNRPGRPPR